MISLSLRSRRRWRLAVTVRTSCMVRVEAPSRRWPKLVTKLKPARRMPRAEMPPWFMKSESSVAITAPTKARGMSPNGMTTRFSSANAPMTSPLRSSTLVMVLGTRRAK